MLEKQRPDVLVLALKKQLSSIQDKVKEEEKKIKLEKEAQREWMNTTSKCITDIVMILLLQTTLIIFLLFSSFKSNISFPKDVSISICRIICSMLLHLVLTPEL